MLLRLLRLLYSLLTNILLAQKDPQRTAGTVVLRRHVSFPFLMIIFQFLIISHSRSVDKAVGMRKAAAMPLLFHTVFHSVDTHQDLRRAAAYRDGNGGSALAHTLQSAVGRDFHHIGVRALPGSRSADALQCQFTGRIARIDGYIELPVRILVQIRTVHGLDLQVLQRGARIGIGVGIGVCIRVAVAIRVCIAVGIRVRICICIGVCVVIILSEFSL